MQNYAQLRLKEIQKILREDWDPIGGGVPDDEYDSYGAEIYSMFLNNLATKESLMNYLKWGESENMGISPENNKRNENVANKLLALFTI
jgi:hypothetical protein